MGAEAAHRAGMGRSPQPPSYPADIAPLRALSFFALGWVVVNQFRDHLGLHAGATFGLVGKGYLGGALFFVLAGFMTCHDYVRSRANGQFNYPSFLWQRLICFYPLHLVALALLGALFVAGQAMGLAFKHGAFNPGDLPANLLLIQAWGALPTDRWNFPSWLVSALWFALLVFPATAWISLKGLRPTLVAVLAPLALFAVAFEVAQSRGVLFTDMTAQIGALQTIPTFLYGAALYRLGQELTVSPRTAKIVAAAAALWVGLAAFLRWSDLASWPAFGPLVLALAETAKSASPALASKLLQRLGAMSLSMYLVYLPVDIVYFHAVQRAAGTLHGAVAWIAWGGVFPAILVAGALAFYLVQRPAAQWLGARDPFARRASV